VCSKVKQNSLDGLYLFLDRCKNLFYFLFNYFLMISSNELYICLYIIIVFKRPLFQSIFKILCVCIVNCIFLFLFFFYSGCHLSYIFFYYMFFFLRWSFKHLKVSFYTVNVFNILIVFGISLTI
jgi:hypothetical protein